MTNPKSVRSDPVPANDSSVLSGGRTLEDASASLDDRRRSNVVLVAHDQKWINTLVMRKNDGLTKYLRGIALASKSGQYAIANMSALSGKPVVQRESYRHAPDEFSANLGG